MKNKVSYFFLRLMFLLFGIVSTAMSEMYVYSVNGNPTVSMDGYFKDVPIEVGMFIHPLMKVQVSHAHNFRVHCGDAGGPVHIVKSAKLVQVLCKHKKPLGTLRSEVNSSYPIIVSPRKPKVLALNQIEWGYLSNTSKYNLTIREFDSDRKVLVDVVLRPSKDSSRYSTQLYRLSEGQKSKLENGKKYSILIKDLNTGRSSERDPGFRGVVQLAEKSEIKDIENNLKKIKKTLGIASLEAYFFAIHLRNQKYYADSTQLLNEESSSVNPVYRHYLQVKNAQSEGVLINYRMRKWIELLVASVKKDNASTAALACVEIRSDYHKLSKFWLDFVGKYKNRKTFKKYCDLTDL